MDILAPLPSVSLDAPVGFDASKVDRNKLTLNYQGLAGAAVKKAIDAAKGKDGKWEDVTENDNGVKVFEQDKKEGLRRRGVCTIQASVEDVFKNLKSHDHLNKVDPSMQKAELIVRPSTNMKIVRLEWKIGKNLMDAVVLRTTEEIDGGFVLGGVSVMHNNASEKVKVDRHSVYEYSFHVESDGDGGTTVNYIFTVDAGRRAQTKQKSGFFGKGKGGANPFGREGVESFLISLREGC